jgi:hypothetical protein
MLVRKATRNRKQETHSQNRFISTIIILEVDVENQSMLIDKTWAWKISKCKDIRGSILQAMTLPPSLPTLRTFPQSLPSILTVAQASGPAAFNFALGSSSNSSSTCPGSNSGFVKPVQTLEIFSESVEILSFKLPCIFAASSSLGVLFEVPVLAAPVLVDAASLVKRSEIAFS